MTQHGVERLARFDGNERLLHWANAVLFGVLMVTAAALYLDPLAALIGRRATVRQIHVIAGLALPVPILAALVGPWRAALRRDWAELARWDAGDRRWLRSGGRAYGDGPPGPSDHARHVLRFRAHGKFHPGQKLNAAATLGFIGVLLGTGAIMRWFGPFPLAWRTGATFVHDWTAIVAVVVVAGHIRMALADRPAMSSMIRGWVPADWARQHRPKWFETETGRPAAEANPPHDSSS